MSDSCAEAAGPYIESALPGRIIDLITDGVPIATLRRRGDPAVYGALVSTAMSAYQRGWSYARWADLVSEPRRELGRQAQLKNGRPRGRDRTEKFLRQAWDRAVQNVAGSGPPITKVELEAEAARRRDLALRAVEDADRPLSANQRRILAYIASHAAEVGSLRIAVPRRELQEQLHLGLTATRNALDRLCELGYLALEERGLPSGPAAKRRRANVYAVASELPAVTSTPIPGTGMWCSEASPSGAPTPLEPGAPAMCGGAPVVNNYRKDNQVITMTVSPEGQLTVNLPGATPREVIDALRAGTVEVVLGSDPHQVDNVTQIFGRISTSSSPARAGSEMRTR